MRGLVKEETSSLAISRFRRRCETGHSRRSLPRGFRMEMSSADIDYASSETRNMHRSIRAERDEEEGENSRDMVKHFRTPLETGRK